MALTTPLRWQRLAGARHIWRLRHHRIDWELWLIRLVHFVLAALLLPAFLAIVIVCLPLILVAAIIQLFAANGGR
jgi:hypothetical protein